MVAHTRSKRALLAGTFSAELLEAIVQIRGDRPLLHNLAGVLALKGSAGRGLFQNEEWSGSDVSQTLIRSIIDRERRVELGQYDIQSELLCVVVTHASQDLAELETLLNEVKSNLPEKHEFHWVHLMEDVGIEMQDLRPLFDHIEQLECHEISTKTESESIQFVSKEWATLLLQVMEYLMLRSPDLSIPDREDVRCYGAASIDFSRREGLRLLEAKSQLDVLNLERDRIHLDYVYLKAYTALNKGKTAYSRVKKKFLIPPDVESFVEGVSSYEAFEPEQKFDAFRLNILEPGGVIESMNDELNREIAEVKESIWSTLDACSKCGQERLTIVNCLLGRPGKFVEGKALRPTLMLEDCESNLMRDAEINFKNGFSDSAAEETSVDTPIDYPTVITLHTQRRMCDEIMDDVVNLERLLEVGAESEKQREEFEERLKARRDDHAKAVQSSLMLRSQYLSYRQELLARFSSAWLENEIAELRQRSVFEYVPPPKEEEAIFTPFEKTLLKGSLLTCLSLLTSWWLLPFVTWLVPVTISTAVVLFWVALAMWRMRKRNDVEFDPLHEQKTRWKEAARQLHQIHVEYGLMQRFDKLFDEEIRKPLLSEAQELQSILDEMHLQRETAEQVVASCFTKIDFVEQLGNADTFNQYYEEQVRPSLVTLPTVIDAYNRVKRQFRVWTAATVTTDYWANLGRALRREVTSMKEFEMLGFLLGNRDDIDVPIFVLKSNSDFGELVRRSRIHLELLHDDSAGSSALIVMHDNRLASHVLDDFKSKLNDLFEESKTNQLDFIATDDPNRVAFLRIGKVLKKKRSTNGKKARKKASSPQTFLPPDPSLDDQDLTE